MSGANIDIAVESEGWDELAGADVLVARAAQAALDAGGRPVAPGAEVSIVLSDDETVRALNARWRGKDKPTNVLSFPACAPEQLASAPHIGDVIIAFETTRREADEEGKALADHLSHLVVHGMLHLLGYDHETDVEAEEMEGLEVRILAGLGIADPYAGAVPGE
ncbi:rRNA maturation RNase YbeY [Chelatococcus composti]|uniref:Endoribonuclease YbeY n=1 Tax=Chelatococcus composti TaxID=1743235 RepID=A0A841KBX6_9HYPH|nr:rRNA maturation RNase YbeY [Chelatococcus composti]MBB6167506.1 putative rRNA maturation factor [Chelatococcus composti]MBS7735710.1 rRNA maturation RNase YbeY [Chelatococcus composti]PZN38586.1 MAG: rRNA maturation RNase YbeY [Pseudomonadota bacterium]GGG32399.1 endoribonuclease YbeY [Chelatococcus composti]